MPSLYLKNYLEFWKKNTFINYSKWRKRRVALSSSKKLSALLTRITSKHDDKYHCLDCCPSSKTKRNLKYHENAHKSKVFCGILMPSKRGNILEYNQ